VALPNEKNILEWYYVISGPTGTPYEGGLYLGKIKFPPEYPFKPPSILMITPNGRFETNKRLCLSMSDYHPETWDPLWSVGSILNGLLSFMLENTPTLGSLKTSESEKRRLATISLEFNQTIPIFRKMFAQYCKEISTTPTPNTTSENTKHPHTHVKHSDFTLLYIAGFMLFIIAINSQFG